MLARPAVLGPLIGQARYLLAFGAAAADAAWPRQPQQQQQRQVWSEPAGAGESRRAQSFYDSTVEKYAEQPVTPLTLEQMLEVGRNVLSDPTRIIQSARFVQEELPKRLARRLLDLQLLPHLVVSNPHIGRLYASYYHAFEVLRLHPPVATLGENAGFCRLLTRLVDEHAPMLDLLAAGLVEVRAKRLVGPALDLDSFLDAMLRSRISRRVMAEQHLQLGQHRAGHVGCIATHLDVAEAVEFAGQRAAQVCGEAYGFAPEVLVGGDVGARLPYIPGHLDYMVYELMKNSMRAVVERHRGATYLTRGRLPPIQARVCAGGGYVTVRLSDHGGGLPPEHIDQVWSYGFTTSPAGVPGAEGLFDPPARAGGAQAAAAAAGGGGGSSSSGDERGPAEAVPEPGGGAGEFGALLSELSDAPRRRYSLAGLGFGLPLSRLHARYFGGDLRLVNLPGYGVDAFLTLRRLDAPGGWRETPDCDAIQAGQAAAVAAAMRVQQQLHQQQPPPPQQPPQQHEQQQLEQQQQGQQHAPER